MATKTKPAGGKPAKPAPSATSKPEVKASLPVTLVSSLPTSAALMKHVQEISKLIPQIEKEMAASRKAGAVALARSFVVLHRMTMRIDETFSPLNKLFDQYKKVDCPEIFEQEGITNVPLAEGYRVGVSVRLYASIIPEKKDEAYQWLRANKLGDLIQNSVNAQTLSATAKLLLEEKNTELPDYLFKTVLVPNISVTSTK